MLALFMFIINLIGLSVAQWLGLPVSHVFSLALIAGAMEFVPVVTLVGASLGGPLGVLLAIPLASILNIFYHDWMHYRRSLKD